MSLLAKNVHIITLKLLHLCINERNKQGNKQTKKYKDMKNFTIILIALLTAVQVSAKKAFPGYVINTNGEKVEGKVFVVSPTYNEVKVKFVDNNNKKETFKAKELTEYGFDVEKFNSETRAYEVIEITYIRKVVEDAPVRFGSKDIMIERQVNGAIKVYNQYIESDSRIGGGLAHFFYVEGENGVEFTKLTKKNYKEVMKAATADFPALQEKIGTRGFGYMHIAKIAQTYNARAIQRNTVAAR